MTPSARLLLGRLSVLSARLERGLLDGAPLPDDVAAVGLDAESEADAAGEPVVLRTVADVFGLDDVAVDVLVAAAGADLLDDVAERCRAVTGTGAMTVGLACRLAGLPEWDPRVRDLLGADGMLVREGLVEVGEGPLPHRPLRLPDVVLGALLGEDPLDPVLRDLLVAVPPLPGPVSDALARALRHGSLLVHVREGRGGAGPSYAAAALSGPSGPPVVVDLGLLAEDGQLVPVVRAALRQAQLGGRGLVVGPLDAPLAEGGLRVALRLLLAAGWPVVTHAAQAWDPSWTAASPVQLDVAAPPQEDRVELWRTVLGTAGDGLDVGGVVGHLALAPADVVRAADVALLLAAVEGAPLAPEHLRAGARRQNAAGLERLTRRLRPRAAWADLVLPPQQEAQLRGLVERVQQRDAVAALGVGGPGGRRRGVTALFAGPPGTGKTLAVEVLAADLGVDVYAVDLATVVDKYIGETEKNLDRVFSQAEGVNAVLLFDEADALFSKRSQVNDAKDRGANLEVAYLLQRIEDFGGVAVLATNLRSNLDEALSRRIDVVVDFPVPDRESRRRLWETALGRAPRADDLDLDVLADVELTGGEIRNVAVSAVTRTLSRSVPLDAATARSAVEEEFRKSGRLLGPPRRS